jgi:hypothetical protein
MRNDSGPLRIAWPFFSIALALSSGVAQLVVTGIGRLALGVIFAVSLSFPLAYFVRRRLAARLMGALRERDRLRDALHYVLDSADAPFSEKIGLVVRIGESGNGDTVRHEVETTPMKPLRYRTFYPIIPDSRKAPSFEDMRFSGEMISPGSASIEILPIRRDRWIRVVALLRPAVKKSCRWVISYHSPGLWDPLRESGRDSLTWRMRRHPGATDESVAEVTISFVPPADAVVSVSERSGRGIVTSASDLAGANYASWQVLDAEPGDLFIFDLQLLFYK